MPLNGPVISESCPNCQIFRITSAQVFTTPVKPTTSAQATVTTPSRLCRSSQRTRRGRWRAHRAEFELPHRRRVDDDAGDDRHDEQQSHQAEEQLARQVGEHVGVQLEQDVGQPAPEIGRVEILPGVGVDMDQRCCSVGSDRRTCRPTASPLFGSSRSQIRNCTT